jgi:hypothetical protein
MFSNASLPLSQYFPSVYPAAAEDAQCSPELATFSANVEKIAD